MKKEDPSFITTEPRSGKPLSEATKKVSKL